MLRTQGKMFGNQVARIALPIIIFSTMSCSDAAPIAAPSTCNGHAELCARSYTAVVYPGTHGSYSDVDEGFEAPDQTHSVAAQLEAGIRVLHFEVHDHDGIPVLCHGICAIGERPLAADLAETQSFIAKNPNNVLTILLERSDDVVTANEIGAAFVTTGLSESLYFRPQSSLSATVKWPTLGQMIQERRQIVALLDNTDGSTYPFLMPRWTVTWETPWNNKVPADFSQCNVDRGTQGNAIYVVDTYLEDQLLPTADHAKLVNIDPFLVDRLLYCQRATQTLPNFVMVNYYEVGDVFHVVDVLNGFAAPPNDDLDMFPGETAWPGTGGAGGASGSG